MQLTAVKLDEWFFPGPGSKLLARDMTGMQASKEIFDNLINPAVSDTKDNTEVETDEAAETGYKSSERTALEKQLLQIENAARAEEARAAAEEEAENAAASESATGAEQAPEYGSEDAPVTSD